MVHLSQRNGRRECIQTHGPYQGSCNGHVERSRKAFVRYVSNDKTPVRFIDTEKIVEVTPDLFGSLPRDRGLIACNFGQDFRQKVFLDLPGKVKFFFHQILLMTHMMELSHL